jgi:hypothetical protein
VIPLEWAVGWIALLAGGGELFPAPNADAVGPALTSRKVEVAGKAARKIEAGDGILLASR